MITKRYHYIFDASGIAEDLLADEELVKKLLVETVDILHMHVLEGPHIAKGIDENPGISGFCIIDYSHISIHTFTDPKEALIDIFSCKPYNPAVVKNYMLEQFHIPEANVHFFEVKYPD